MAGTQQAHIVFDQVEVKYSEYVSALRGVSLSIQRGDFVFLCGKTGTGKSTLLKTLTKEVRATSGSVKIWGVDMNDIPDEEIPLLRRSMGIIPQDYGLLPRKRVWENVAYAMRAVGATKKQVREKVPQILESVNIGHRADAFPHQLSGGEQQRVAIGRALINDPKLLIADEPTGNLDPEHSWEIMELLLQLNRKGATVLVASHDMMVIERMGRRIITLEGGRIASDQTAPILPDLEDFLPAEMDPGEEIVPEAPAEEPDIIDEPIPVVEQPELPEQVPSAQEEKKDV
jgi:cell division transport system ATP-binding protein